MTFVTDDRTLELVSIDVVVGRRPVKIFLLDDDGADKKSFVVEKNTTLTVPVAKADRILARTVEQTKADQSKKDVFVIPHRIEW